MYKILYFEEKNKHITKCAYNSSLENCICLKHKLFYFILFYTFLSTSFYTFSIKLGIQRMNI